MRLIDADALIGELHSQFFYDGRDRTRVYAKIQGQPTIAERKTGKWIQDRSGAYCCSNCMEPCATYIMMKPRDKFCKMCGKRMEVEHEVCGDT